MKRALEFFIDNYKFTLILVLFVLLAGVQGSLVIQRETRPSVDFAAATITTVWPGSSPEEVSDRITRKIEDELRGISGIKDVKSISQAGLSTISVRIDMDRVDTEKVLNDIQRAIQRVSDLPTDLREDPEFLHINVKEIPILEIGLTGSNENRRRDKLAYELKRLLEDEDGVAEARLSGYREREFQILLNAKKLARFQVGIHEAFDAVRRRTRDIPAGFTRNPEDRKLVRVTGQVKEAKDLEEINVRTNDSAGAIRIRDIATVVDGAEDPSVNTFINGEAATLLIVTKKEFADGIRTTNALHDRVEQFEKTLPEGYSVVIYNDEGSRIEDRLGIVISNALQGMVLVFVILMIFLPGTLGVMTSLSLPLCILGTLGLMPVLGANFNTITMLALVIAIGMLVDNSIVISENYARLRQEGWNAREAAVHAAYQFWLPLTATVLTTIAAFLPMLVTKGIMGQFIRWIPIVVTAALTMSLFEGFFLLPARLQFTIRKPKLTTPESELTVRKNWFDRLKDRFESFVRVCITWRYAVLGIVLFALVSSVLIARFGNRFELFAREEVEQYFARFEMPIHYGLAKTDEYAQDISKDIFEVIGRENVETITVRTGIQRLGMRDPDEKNGEHVGMIIVGVPRERAAVLDPNKILEELRAIDKGEAEQLTFQIGGNGPPVGKAMSITFRTDRYAELVAIVEKFKEQVGQIPGVKDLTDDIVYTGREFRLQPSYRDLSFAKLDVEALGTSLRTAFQGAVASELTENGVDFDIRIRFEEEDANDLASIERILVTNPMGNLIPVRNVANVTEVDGPYVQKHFNFVRAVTVSSDVDPKTITSVVLNAKARGIVSSILKDHPAVSVVFGGEDESFKESVQSLKNAMLLSVLGIFGILVFLFHGYVQPFLILTCIPLGLIGVNMAFFLHQKPLTFFALIGVVGLAGVVVNSAIVLISYINELRERRDSHLHDILAAASADRLRAVLVTSLTTVGGLFPTAYSIGGHDSVLVPMTLALAWGLVSGTILTIIWLPCSYAILEDLFATGRWLVRRS